MPSKGDSTAFAPIHVKTIRIVIRNQKLVFFEKQNFVGLFLFNNRGMKIKIEVPNATTPPSFEGMDRKIT
jgi:hypothetical protein